MSPNKNSKYSPNKTNKSPKIVSEYPQDIQCVIHSSNQAHGSLFISNIEAAQNIHTLIKHKIKSIISCAKGYQVIHSQQDVPYYKHFPAIDNQSCNISIYFDQAADFIAQTLQKTNVLVHCIAGVSRSPTLVLAYLIKYKGTTLEKAYKYLLGKRRIIYPNNSFINQLSSYEKHLNEIQLRSRSLDLTRSQPKLHKLGKSEEKKITQSFLIKSPISPSKKMQTTSPAKGGNAIINHSPSQRDKIRTKYQNRYNISPEKSLYISLSNQIGKSIQILKKKRQIQKSPKYNSSLSNFYQVGKDYRLQKSPLRYSSRYFSDWRYQSSYITGQRTRYYDVLYNRLKTKDHYSPSRR